MPIEPGSTIINGRYQIDRILGQGSYGIVYLAEDTKLKRLVAIKHFRSLIEQEEKALKRFFKEAQVIAALSNPYIITIHDLEREDPNYYLIMEYAEKGSLLDLIGDPPKALPLADALQMIILICEGLQAVHDSGVLHRDLKPGNILIKETNGKSLSETGTI